MLCMQVTVHQQRVSDDSDVNNRGPGGHKKHAKHKLQGSLANLKHEISLYVCTYICSQTHIKEKLRTSE